MKYGLSEITIEKIRGVFEAFPEIEKAILYGSRAKGNFKPTSDIDLTLYGDALTPDLRLTIASELDDLLLPYTIDLSIFAELNHAKLREHIERVGVVFYERKKQGAAMKEGWKTKKLGDVCSFLNRGVSPKYVEDGGIVVLNQRCVRDHRVSFEVARRHDVKAKKIGSERLIQAGDVLVNSTGSGTLGRVAQLRNDPPEPTTVDSHVTIVRPMPGLFFQEFFGYMLRDIEDAIKVSGEGCGGQTELGRSVLAEKFLVRFPKSFPKQQRIVAILDEAFDGIATAKANAEKNLQNARALFESHLQSVFTQRGERWKLVRIEDACESIMDCVNKTAPKVDGPTPFKMIRTTNVRNGYVNLESVYYVTEEVFRIWTRRQIPMRGDVILTREAPMGEVGMLLSDDQVFLGQRLVSYRANATKLDNRFLLYAFQSDELQGQIHALASGSTVQHMRVPDSKNLQLSLPSLSTQREIVTQLDALREETQRLESLYRHKLTALDALKKSLLNQAFTGQL